ncbi:hypothetical protein Cgig2_031834 [Carnegiea gigantea]|uniref:S1 motif domain-containing protein n=1 Tax=Carnegiea gigantea TaxID=171969 RepID=A0A9Q1QQ05_9CARY|nr:hypothetical protein Cgig2_031834 [Carnegiea gigantea]
MSFQLLVLDIEGNNLIFCLKYSFVHAAQQLPADAKQILSNSVVHGYVCNLIETGCFVRFLGHLTGFSPRKRALDDRNTDLSEAFYAEEKIAKLQGPDSGGSESDWVENFRIGCAVEGRIHEAKDVGVVISFEKYADVGGKALENGSTVRAVVLDVAKTERMVNLSLKPEFLKRSDKDSNAPVSKKKRKREAKELKSEDYLVVSLLECYCALGYAAVADYNTQRLHKKQFSHVETVIATILALPSDETAGQLLLLLESCRQKAETSSSKKVEKRSGYDVGGFLGRVHITETNDQHNVENPFSIYKVGQTLTARVIGKCSASEKNEKVGLWELSLKPSVLSTSPVEGNKQMDVDFNYSVGQLVNGYVYRMDNEWVWGTISRQAFVLDSSREPDELLNFQKRFMVGSIISGHVLSMNREIKSLRSVPRPFSAFANGVQNLAKAAAHQMRGGDVLGGRVWKVLPSVGGILVQIGPHIYGKVHYTELTDSWVSDPLSGYHERQFVKCKVLEINHSVKGTVHVDLSLRTSSDGTGSWDCHFENVEDIQPNMEIKGYVPEGCFFMLSRNLDGKILLGNLSDGYVQDPGKELPVGKLVTGKILSVGPLSKRVEVTLKVADKNNARHPSQMVLKAGDLSSLHIGDGVKGRIKRVESFGLFIVIDDTNLTELAGQRVTANILKVDVERRRISLGMKASYFEDEDHEVSTSSLDSGEEMEADLDDYSVAKLQLEDDMPQSSKSDSKLELEDGSALVHVVSRASVPSLEVVLDDMEEDDVADVPRTTDEFERAVRTSPNSSFVWIKTIKYMQFMLSMADVEEPVR